MLNLPSFRACFLSSFFFSLISLVFSLFLSLDASEVIGVNEWVTDWQLAHMTDVTLVSDDTYGEDKEEGEAEKDREYEKDEGHEEDKEN